MIFTTDVSQNDGFCGTGAAQIHRITNPRATDATCQVSILKCGGLWNPKQIVLSPDETTLYETNEGGHDLTMTSTGTGVGTNLAGSGGSAGSVDGPAAVAKFNQPRGAAISPDGRTLYVAGGGEHKVRGDGSNGEWTSTSLSLAPGSTPQVIASSLLPRT